MLEQFANQLIPATLQAQLNSGALSGTLSSAAGLPTQGPFHIVVGPGDSTDEIIVVGSISGTAISNLIRGAEGTTARTWASGTPVNHGLTADALRGLVQNQLADYTIFYDGTNYCARNERTGEQDFTSNTSLHNVFNSASAALGTGHLFDTCGGLIKFSTPSGHRMFTTQPLLVYDQQTILAPGRACIITAQGAAGWSGGTHNAPKAMICGGIDDTGQGGAAHTFARGKLEGIAFDCAGIAGTTGIWFERHNLGDTGGNESHTYINFCEVRDFVVDGIAVSGGGTSACWMLGNNLCHTDSFSASNARGFNVTSADVHLLTANNVKIKAATGWCAYLSGNSIAYTGESHLVNNGANTSYSKANGVGPGLIGLFGADHCRVSEIYFDNMDRVPAVWVNPGGSSGVSSRSQVANCFMHCDPSVNNDLSLVRIDNSQGPAYGIVVQGNSANEDQSLAGSKLASMVDVINGAAGRNPAQKSLMLALNTARKCTTFVTADFGGTALANLGGLAGSNIIDNNIDTGSGAGAPANILVGP